MAEPLVLSVDFDEDGANKKLKEIKNEYTKLNDEVKNITTSMADVNKKLEATTALLEEWDRAGTDSNVIKGLKEDVAALSSESQEYQKDLDYITKKTQELRAEYQKIAGTPMLDKNAMKQAQKEAKDVAATVKSIGDTAQAANFEKLDLSQYSGKAVKLASDVNKANQAYAAQEARVEKIKSQLNAMLALQKQQSATGIVSDAAISKTNKLQSELAAAETRLEALGVKAQGAGRKLEEGMSGAEKGTEKTNRTLQRFLFRLERVFQTALVFSAIYAMFQKLKEGFTSLIKANDGWINSLRNTKGNFAAAFMPLYDIALPVIDKVIKGIEKMSAYLVAFMSRISGKSVSQMQKEAQALQDKIAQSTEKATAKYDAQIDKLEDEEKALRRQIKAIEASTRALEKQYEAQKKVYDDQRDALREQIDAIEEHIDQLQRKEDAEQAIIDRQKDNIQQQIDALNDQKDALKDAQDAERDRVSERKAAIDSEISGVDKEISAIQKLIDARKAELEANQKSLAGFDTLNILQTNENDPELEMYEQQIEALKDKKDALQEQKDAIPKVKDDPMIKQIEAQIRALRRQKDAIQDVDYSAAIQKQKDMITEINKQISALDKLSKKLKEEHDLKVNVNEEAIEKIQGQIDKINETKDAVNNLKDKEINVSVKVQKTDGIELITDEQLDDILTKAKKITTALGTILTTIGLITANPLYIVIGFTVAFASLISLLKEEWEKIKERVQKNWDNDISEFIKFALISLWTDVKQRLNQAEAWIGIKFKNIGEKISEIFGNAWNSIKDGWNARVAWLFSGEYWKERLDEIGAKLKEGWEKHFAYLFTKEWWSEKFSAIKDGAKDALSGVLDIFERAINWIIDKLNELSWDVPEWVPVIGGETWGFDIPNIDIPALAQGAVLPGGKPYLALVNDQPAGQTNIETPLSTMIQAFKMAQSDNKIEVTVNFTGTGAQIARMLLPDIQIAQKNKSAFT
jgi:DNA repair exonuclease SbcCD ATPase subunit